MLFDCLLCGFVSLVIGVDVHTGEQLPVAEPELPDLCSRFVGRHPQDAAEAPVF